MGAKVINFYVQSFPHMRVIGKGIRVNLEITLEDRTIETLWENMAKDGSLDCLLALPGRLTETKDTVGWMGDFKPGDPAYTYLAGVLVHGNAPVPEGFESRDIASCDMAVAWIKGTDGTEGGDMMANASENMGNAMKEHGYEYDGSHGFFEMEYYSYERLRGPAERGEPLTLDFYSPCKKANVK